MALPGTLEEKRELREEHQRGEQQLLVRYYESPPGGTSLSTYDLELGDPLPDDANAVIVDSGIVTDRKAGGRVLKVIAIKAIGYSATDSGGMLELARTRGRIQVGDENYQGRRRWKCPNTLAYALADTLWDQPFPGVGGSFVPRARHVEADLGALAKGVGVVTALYKTVRTVGQARLLIDTTEMPGGTEIEDLDGNILWGRDGDGIHEWKLIRGDATLWTPFCDIILQTAYYASDFQLATVMNLWRHVNDADLPNFGNAKAGTMLSFGARIKDWKWGDELVNLDYRFRWSGLERTWNEWMLSQKGLWLVQEQPVFERNFGTGTYDVLPAQTKNMLQFVPGAELTKVGDTFGLNWVGPENRRMFEEGDFSDLDTMVTW